MRAWRALLLLALVVLLLIGIIGCEASPEPPAAPVDEPYYGEDEVIAIVKQQLPNVMLNYHVVVDGKVVDKPAITGDDLRCGIATRWEAKYLGRGKWDVTCAINFVNWFDYEKPMNAIGTFTWNFYEKSNTVEYLIDRYQEITYGEYKP